MGERGNTHPQVRPCAILLVHTASDYTHLKIYCVGLVVHPLCSCRTQAGT